MSLSITLKPCFIVLSPYRVRIDAVAFFCSWPGLLNDPSLCAVQFLEDLPGRRLSARLSFLYQRRRDPGKGPFSPGPNTHRTGAQLSPSPRKRYRRRRPGGNQDRLDRAAKKEIQ